MKTQGKTKMNNIHKPVNVNENAMTKLKMQRSSEYLNQYIKALNYSLLIPMKIEWRKSTRDVKITKKDGTRLNITQ